MTLALLLALAAHAAAPVPDAKPGLEALVESVRKSPADAALRARAVAAAAAMKPAPELPPAARRASAKAAAFIKEARSESDYGLAVAAYESALGEAPWWAEGYYNLAVAQEKAGRFAEAAASLELYLAAKPADAAAVEDRLAALEAKQELAERRMSPAGRWRMTTGGARLDDALVIERAGSSWRVARWTYGDGTTESFSRDGRSLAFRVRGELSSVEAALTLSEDGARLEGTVSVLAPDAAQKAAARGRGVELSGRNVRAERMSYERQ